MIDVQDQQGNRGRDNSLTRGERANLVMRANLGDWKQKLALIILDQYSGQDRRCWPWLSSIAGCMNVCRRTATEAISRLTARGIVRYRDQVVGRASRSYVIDYTALAGLQPPPPPQQQMPLIPAADAWDPRMTCATPAHEVRDPQARHARVPSTSCATPAHEVRDYNKQTTAIGNINEHGSGAAAVCADVPEVARGEDQDPEKIRRAQHLLRARLKAIRLLTEAGVWGKALAGLIEIAAADDGNPLPRVVQAIQMADEAKPTDRGAWIKEAIEKGWRAPVGQGAQP